MENRITVFVISSLVAIIVSSVLIGSTFVALNSVQQQERFTEVWVGGDGLGVNLTIAFFGKKYRTTWVGCLGEYGRAEGEFVKTEDHIRFNPKTEAGMMKDRFRAMRVVRKEGQEYLIDVDDENAMDYLEISGLKKLNELERVR